MPVLLKSNVRIRSDLSGEMSRPSICSQLITLNHKGEENNRIRKEMQLKILIVIMPGKRFYIQLIPLFICGIRFPLYLNNPSPRKEYLCEQFPHSQSPSLTDLKSVALLWVRVDSAWTRMVAVEVEPRGTF